MKMNPVNASMVRQHEQRADAIELDPLLVRLHAGSI
jgi:hypothetical protein